jgi:hypothetical protein
VPLSTASGEWVDRHPPVVKPAWRREFESVVVGPETRTWYFQQFAKELWRAWYHSTWCKGTCGHTFSW